MSDEIKKSQNDAPNYRKQGEPYSNCEACFAFNLKTNRCGLWQFDADPAWTCDSYLWRSINTFNPLTEKFEDPSPPEPFVGEAPYFMLPSSVRDGTTKSEVRKSRKMSEAELLVVGKAIHKKPKPEKKPKPKKKVGKCKFCKEGATKGIVWADGRGMVKVCDSHVKRGKNAVPGKIDEVRKLEDAKKNVKKFFAEFVQKAVAGVTEEDAPQQIVIAPVLEPGTKDDDGNHLSNATIEKAAYNFMRDFQLLKLQHSDTFMEFSKDFHIVESYIALEDFLVGSRVIKQGSWVLGVQVLNAEVWKLILEGKLTGFSMGGIADVIPEETTV